MTAVEVVRFFASVIKSDEPWSEECERAYRAAMAEPVKPWVCPDCKRACADGCAGLHPGGPGVPAADECEVEGTVQITYPDGSVHGLGRSVVKIEMDFVPMPEEPRVGVNCWACNREAKGKPTTVKHVCGKVEETPPARMPEAISPEMQQAARAAVLPLTDLARLMAEQDFVGPFRLFVDFGWRVTIDRPEEPVGGVCRCGHAYETHWMARGSSYQLCSACDCGGYERRFPGGRA